MVFSCVYVFFGWLVGWFVYLFVCLFFLAISQKLMQLSSLNVDMVHHKSMYFVVEMSKVRVTRHNKQCPNKFLLAYKC